METKKNPKSNLENYRSTFFLFGLLLSLMVVAFSINYSQADVSTITFDNMSDVIIDEEMIISTPPQKVTPPPPPQNNVNQSIIEIVKDDVDLVTFDFPTFEEDVIFVDIPDFSIPEINDDDSVFIYPTSQAIFTSEGEEGIRIFVAKNVIYPDEAIENEIEGTVVVRFVVKKDKSIGEIQILNEGKVDPILVEEAKRVIKLLPDFEKPAYNNGRPVNSWFVLPIVFELN